MDFFKYSAIALEYINSDTLYVPLIVGTLCFLLVFIFEAVGMFIIAGREGYKNRWMAFIPFFNTYYIGVCAQKNRLFKNVSTTTFSMIAAIVEAVLFVGFLVDYIACFQLILGNCLNPIVVSDEIVGYQLINITSENAWAAWCYECLYDYILSWLQLVFIALQVFVFSAFFQTYASRKYLIFTIMSVLFPICGILIYILRNNRGMNYRDFMRMEQERQYRMYYQYSNPNNNDPYANGNNRPYSGYQNTPYNPPESRPSPEDPFSEYGGKGGNSGNGGDPFEN